MIKKILERGRPRTPMAPCGLPVLAIATTVIFALGSAASGREGGQDHQIIAQDPNRIDHNVLELSGSIASFIE